VTSKYELSGTVYFHPVLLYEEDLLELEKILLDPTSHKNDKLTFELAYKERRYRASTVKDLLEYEGLPKSTDRLSIKRFGWVENAGKADINRSIILNLYHGCIDCYINSYDEDWYKGKLSRLKEFFKERKPWYSFLNKIGPIY
jgi:hypothetical protein